MADPKTSRAQPRKPSAPRPLPRPAQAFGKVLLAQPKDRKPLPAVGPTLPSRAPAPGRLELGPALPARGGLTAEGLLLTRARMSAQAVGLSAARHEGMAAQEERINGRLLELIVRELSLELTQATDRRGATAAPPTELEPRRERGAPRQEGAAGGGAAPAAGRPEPAVADRGRAQAAVALVRKIETFLRSERPALTLEVAGALDAKVEVARTGHREVALQISGNRRPPPPEELERLRRELGARGLKLSALRVT
jgi:hypothetical protein